MPSRLDLENLSPVKRALYEIRSLRKRVGELERARAEPIAIVGMGLRFPGGASDANSLWDILAGGVDTVTEIPDSRWPLDRYYDPDPAAPGKMYTRHGAFIEDPSLFDAPFFGISAREAATLDPQQRILLEVAWEAIENSGCNPASLGRSATGVFLALSNSDYGRRVFGQTEEIDAYASTGNILSVAAGRISYALGLAGPSMVVDTACSGSLVALHLACQSLRGGECGMALAGGVNLILSPEININLSKARMMSADGKCKTFDASADGYVRGEGCGVVVLKRLADALAGGDNILALIRGSAVNQDGRSAGLTVPSGVAQEALLRQALANAGVQPEAIGYVEAHGTGTALGDPIEAHALARVLGPDRTDDNPLILGSVKTNLGHLEAAAGIAGIIKVVLSLQNELIPKLLHFQKLNPHIHWGSVPIEIPVDARPWKRGATPRLAGVSSFGFSGTNAHVIVEEAPEREATPSDVEMPLRILGLSARDEVALRQLGERYAKDLGRTQATLADFCYTANTGRAQWRERTFCTASTRAGMRDALLSGRTERGSSERAPAVVFLFSGQGSQYAGMGKELYATQPVFRSALDECAGLLDGVLEERLTEVLWGRATALLAQTLYTQPALFALEYALAELWKSWGIIPAAVLGHSIGEYAAACVAGVYSLADGLKLVVARARLMQGASGDGVMTAVRASEEQARAALVGLEDRVSIAAMNAPGSVVISGFEPEVRAAETALRARGISLRRLRVSHAFHSPQMSEIETAFESVAAEIHYRAPQIPLISSVTGRPVEPTEMNDPLYWRRQVRQPVRFSDAMEALRKQGHEAFVEIGPGATLLALGRQCMASNDAGLWAPSLREGCGEWAQILESLGRLYVRGAEVDWKGFDEPYARRRVALPTYPFQRQRYWIEMKPPEPIPALDRRGAELRIECGLDQYESLRAELDPLCSDYAVSALRAAGWDFRAGASAVTAELETRCGIAGKQKKLFSRLLEILSEDGVLAKNGETWIVQSIPRTRDTGAAMLNLLGRYPKFEAELRMTARCAESLAGVLQGKIDALDLLFPDGSASAVEKIYAESPGARVFNRLAAEIVAAEVNRRTGGMIRVLEIGAGTGGTTAAIAPVLPAGRAEYVYTDVSPFFEIHSARKFEQYPFLRYRTLDIEKDPESQSFAGEQFDIVIAANVLHATASLRQALRHARRLLAPGGLLVLVEGTSKERWLDLTFGLTEGWWRFGDHDPRASHPLLAPPAWLDLLKESGFENSSVVRVPGNAPQAIFLARSSGIAASSSQATGTVRPADKYIPPALPGREEIRNTTSQERRARLIDYLSESVASILRAERTRINPARPITEFGLDSLMALELRNRLHLGLGVNIPTVRFLDGSTIGDLAALADAALDELPAAEPAAVSSRTTTDYPLSHGQQAQWFGYKCMPDSSTFNVGFTAKAFPSLEWNAFERALEKLTARHAALRSILLANGEGYPAQRILPPAPPDAVLIDSRKWSEVELRERVLQDFRRTFDLARPMFRVSVFRGDSGDVILFSVHHLMIDARSLQLCLKDLKVLYAAELDGVEAALEPLTACYRDFVEAEAAMMAGPESERLWEYWRGRLSGELPVLRLPSSRQRPEIVLPRGESIPMTFEPGLLAEVQRAARKCRVTGYSFLLACYQLLLHLYTGQDDIVVGTSASARDDPRWANVVGYFVNILPMRSDLSGNPSFARHLEHTRDTVLGALAHQEFPFSLMVSRLRLRRSPDRSPVFQTFFNFLTDRVGELGSLFLGVRDCQVEFGRSVLHPWMVIPQQEGQSEIVLQLSEVGGRLGGSLNYNSDVIDRGTAEAMAVDFRRIVASAVLGIDTPIALLLPDSEPAISEREEIVL